MEPEIVEEQIEETINIPQESIDEPTEETKPTNEQTLDRPHIVTPMVRVISVGPSATKRITRNVNDSH